MGRRDGHAAALHPRPRERRLGARGRLRGHQRRSRRHGDPAPHPHLRPVPRVPGRGRHALRELHVPRPVHRRRHGRVPAHFGPRLREARSQDAAAGRRRARRRGHHRLPRGPQGDPAALPGHHRGGHRRRRPRPHRHPVPVRPHRDEHRRRRPQPGGAQARRATRRGPDGRRRRQPRRRGEGPDRRQRRARRARLRGRAGRGDGRVEHDRPGRLLLRDRLRRHADHSDPRHHLHRAEHHRQHRRHVQRPRRADGARPGGQGHPAHQGVPADGGPDALADLDAGRVRGRAILVPE